MQLEPGHSLEVEPDPKSHSGTCECCGKATHTIFGFVHYDTGATVSAYCAKWTVDNPEHPPWLLLSIGPWGGATSGRDRVTVGLILRFHDGQPNFTVVDAAELEWREESLVGFQLARDQVIGAPIAKTAFAITDEIVLHDPRVQALIRNHATTRRVERTH